MERMEEVVVNRLQVTPRMLMVVLATAWMAVAAVPRALERTSTESDVLQDATIVFQHATLPPTAIPLSVLAQARAIAVVPGARRDGGLYYGTGVLSGRSGFDGWTPPAIVSFQGSCRLNWSRTKSIL